MELVVVVVVVLGSCLYTLEDVNLSLKNCVYTLVLFSNMSSFSILLSISSAACSDRVNESEKRVTPRVLRRKRRSLLLTTWTSE